MAGHSKWANIKHRKGRQDAQRGKLFTKLIKEIMIAARTGDPEPANNPRLRLAIQNARGANVPKDNIERAISKGSSDDSDDYLEVTYEGYAPNGVAVFVECSTDNLNRTVASVRSIFTKNGGSLATHGSVDFLFDRKGIFLVQILENFDLEAFEFQMIEANAEEIEQTDDYLSITCGLEDFGSVQQKLEDLKIEVKEAGLIRIPTTTIELDDEEFILAMKLIEKLEQDDDTQNIYHNLELKENQMNLLD